MPYLPELNCLAYQEQGNDVKLIKSIDWSKKNQPNNDDLILYFTGISGQTVILPNTSMRGQSYRYETSTDLRNWFTSIDDGGFTIQYVE